MKGIAFALDPDGYWIELVSRSVKSPIKLKYTLAQTMMRVKDPVKSLHFYRDLLGEILTNVFRIPAAKCIRIVHLLTTIHHFYEYSIARNDFVARGPYGKGSRLGIFFVLLVNSPARHAIASSRR